MQGRSEEYHTDSKGNLQAAQKRIEERRAQQGVGTVVPLPKRTVGASVKHQPSKQSAAAQASEDDSYWPFVPPGKYSLAFVKEKKVTMWKRTIWHVSMRIVEGEHFGKVLPYYLNAIPQGKKPTRGYYISTAFAVATDRRPPKDLWRRRPASFLAGCVFLGRVRTGKKDSQQVELPEAAHTSKVECLLKRIAGTLPSLERDKE